MNLYIFQIRHTCEKNDLKPKVEYIKPLTILKEDDKNREELCSKQEIVMLAGQDKVVKILYGPTRCKMALAKLEIKAPVGEYCLNPNVKRLKIFMLEFYLLMCTV